MISNRLSEGKAGMVTTAIAFVGANEGKDKLKILKKGH